MEKIEDLVKNEVKRTFNPEFLNRIDEIILFQSPHRRRPDPDSRAARPAAQREPGAEGHHHLVTEDAKKWILEKTLVDRSYGARPLRRALQRYVEDPLSEALIAGGITERPAFLEVYLDNNQLFYRPVVKEGEDKAAGTLLVT